MIWFAEPNVRYTEHIRDSDGRVIGVISFGDASNSTKAIQDSLIAESRRICLSCGATTQPCCGH